MNRAPNLGIFAKTFSRPTLGKLFDAIASHGLRCVQFNFSCAGLPTLPDHVEPSLLSEIESALKVRDIRIAAVSGTFNMIHPEVEKRHDGLRRLLVLASACARLKVPVITLCTGTRDPEDMWRPHPENNSSQSWRDLLATLGTALLIAETHGVSLAIEPETGNVVNSAHQGRRLLDELRSPRLKVVIDAANLLHPGNGTQMSSVLEGAFDLLGPDIVLAHAKELGPSFSPTSRGPGSGVLDWDHYLSKLRAIGFQGAWVLHGLEEADVPRSVAFLKSKLGAT